MIAFRLLPGKASSQFGDEIDVESKILGKGKLKRSEHNRSGRRGVLFTVSE